jgi:two-component system sensor histidine kinase BaeS
LLDNAIKFSDRCGRQVTVSVQPVENGVEVDVTDQGVGIRNEDLPYLFDRFRQIDRGKMEQQGCGIGLAIARGLIHLHGGEIYVTSVIGQGSTFTIRLPSEGKGGI